MSDSASVANITGGPVTGGQAPPRGNVDASAVNTLHWLATTPTIAVPVYQRQYRWDIGACEQLLADIRAVADAGEQHTHFLGSILSSGSAEDGELVLIDGQQRVTTLMLLIAALRHTVAADDPALAERLQQILLRGPAGEADPPDRTTATRTTLRPHRAWAEVFSAIVADEAPSGAAFATAPRESRFDDNYAFFRSRLTPEEAARIWRGVQRLEHVAIRLGADANAQQIFESLNSTGTPLTDHELIHNYVLMGLSHAEQREIEDAYWLPIEAATGESIGAFWRHYLVMRTGREVDRAGGRGVYDAFRQQFPRLSLPTLRAEAEQWRAYALIYRVLLDPAAAPTPDLRQRLADLNVFGPGLYPLVLHAYRDHEQGRVDAGTLTATLDRLLALLLRRTVVEIGNERLVARLCRAWAEGPDRLLPALARITPSDQRVRVALKYRPLPQPDYVLRRLAGVPGEPAGGPALLVDHVVPLAPAEDWSGGGVRTWAELSDDEQNSLRALAPTLGNLALLEDALFERALDRSFPAKQAVYATSRIPLTRALADQPAWTTAAIGARTERLTEQFLRVWPRPVTSRPVDIDDDGLTPILDAKRRRGWPRGWEREFDYVEYRGEHWEVHDVRALFQRVFTRLWANSRDDVVAFSARNGGPVFDAQDWNGPWAPLSDGRFLYLGWDSRYLLTAVQGVLDQAGLASEVFVKYSYLAAYL